MLNIDLSGVQEQGTTVPEGTHSVIIDKAEVSPTRSGGSMIKVQLKIKEGPSTGRVIFEQFNIENANPQAVQIGLGQLKGLLKAFGHPNPNKLGSTTEMVGLKGLVVTRNVDSAEYGPQTKVKAYKSLAPAVEAQATAASATPQASQANPFA